MGPAIQGGRMEGVMRRTTDEIPIRRYLLGDLSHEERLRFEDEYLADAELFEEFLATENDLIDAYVRGELTKDEREKFEAEYCKSPERREKVEFARTLRQVCALPKEAALVVLAQKASPWKKVWAALSVAPRMPQWAAAAAMIVAWGSWLIVQNRSLRVDLQQALAGQAELRREADTLRQHIVELENSPKDRFHANEQGTEVAKLETPAGSEVTFKLTPGILRSSGGPQNSLNLPPTTSELWLQLILDRDERRTYEAVLLTADRKEIFRGKGLQSHSIGGIAVVAWRLPARSILSGDYVVQLRGRTATGSLEDVESYGFRVLRK